MKEIVKIWLPALLIFVGACHSTKHISGGSEMLYQFQWNLTELNGQSVEITTTKNPYLLFYTGKVSRVSRNTGCNNLTGTFLLEELHHIKFYPLATTRMACAGMNIEAPFIEVIGQVNTWNIIDKQLVFGKGNKIIAKFSAVNPSSKPVEIQTPLSLDLKGAWQLNYISGSRISFEGLYPDKKPQINFDTAPGELGGSNSCNGFSSKIFVDGNKISIAAPFAKTMIFCDSGGENSFLNMLAKVNRYELSNATSLNFMIDDVPVMHFTKITTTKE